jgi:hypothetical protein
MPAEPCRLSYRLRYRRPVAQRHKRSISLAPDLDDEIEKAAAAAGMSVSAWLAETVKHRLRIDAGRRGLAEWEAENGALTQEELAEAGRRVDEATSGAASNVAEPRDDRFHL